MTDTSKAKSAAATGSTKAATKTATPSAKTTPGTDWEAKAQEARKQAKAIEKLRATTGKLPTADDAANPLMGLSSVDINFFATAELSLVAERLEKDAEDGI